MTLPYKVTWFHFDPKDDTKSVSREADTFAEALELIPHGPVGWQLRAGALWSAAIQSASAVRRR